MGARLSKDERRAVAQRVFAALCVHNPKHYVALIEPKLPASSPERVLTTSGAASTLQGADNSTGGKPEVSLSRIP
jgi:hypothetical protein